MARRCTTVPGYGACCRAAMQGIASGRTFQMTDHLGHTRCGVCTTRPTQSKDPRKQGTMVSVFRFARNAMCGIGPSGCPALASQTGNVGLIGQIPLPGLPNYTNTGGVPVLTP